MAFTNLETKEIHCKILYLGPHSAGKTANLRSIYLETADEANASNLQFVTEEPTKFFDFLPVSMGHFQDFHLKMHLFTLPDPTLFPTAASIMLRGIDGFVYVADSDRNAVAANPSTLAEVRNLMIDEGIQVADLPFVLQYNKRDLPDAMPVEVMSQQLNPSGNYPAVEAIASEGKGTRETLTEMAKLVVRRLNP
jgi:mutual gliding-motility protein MglA